MSLDYDIRSIPDNVKYKGNHMSPITTCIIFATIPVDIGEISIDNYKEFYMRYCLFNTANNCLYSGFSAVPAFSLADVKNHIGLKTNVYGLTRRVWVIKRLGQQYITEALNREDTK